jgi:NAD(P)-dependent dehydrogenase (short-subunit alcohol dehydrogenase family)
MICNDRKGRPWTAADIPEQRGRVAVVTGANAGLGFETARVLAAHGATVVLACRDPKRAEQAAVRIESKIKGANLRLVHLDLASLASVREAAAQIRSLCPHVDLLINNAGVMDVPHHHTVDGFELTLATNHLGHFALTGLLLDRLLLSSGSRIVTVSSQAHRRGVIHFEDLQLERSYRPMTAYEQSKLANLLFTYKLQSHLEATGAQTRALAAYPGDVRTNLWRTSSLAERVVLSPRLRFVTFWLLQDPEMGALPTLRAAVDPAAQGGDCYGPAGRFETRYPIRVESSPQSHDAVTQRRLWEVSEQLTGVYFQVDAPSAPQVAPAQGRASSQSER